jgi:hypothetical protein
LPSALMPTDPFAVASTCPRRPQPEELELHKLELHCTAQTGTALWDCTGCTVGLHCTAQTGTARGVGTAQAAQSPLIRTLGCQCFIAAGLHELADLVGACCTHVNTHNQGAECTHVCTGQGAGRVHMHKSRSRVQARMHACTGQGAECTRTHKSRSRAQARTHAGMHRARSRVHAHMHARTHRSRAVPQQAGVGNSSPLGQLCQTAAVLRSLQPVTPAPCISVLSLLL